VLSAFILLSEGWGRLTPFDPPAGACTAGETSVIAPTVTAAAGASLRPESPASAVASLVLSAPSLVTGLLSAAGDGATSSPTVSVAAGRSDLTGRRVSGST